MVSNIYGSVIICCRVIAVCIVKCYFYGHIHICPSLSSNKRHITIYAIVICSNAVKAYLPSGKFISAGYSVVCRRICYSAKRYCFRVQHPFTANIVVSYGIVFYFICCCNLGWFFNAFKPFIPTCKLIAFPLWYIGGNCIFPILYLLRSKNRSVIVKKCYNILIIYDDFF